MQEIKIFKDTESNEEEYSINDLVQLDKRKIDEKIFRLLESGESFRFVQIKVKDIGLSEQTLSQNEILIQINDISHKMFYSKAQERQQILEMINATVSHELRNPLQAIIGQVQLMEVVFQAILKIMGVLRNAPGMKKVYDEIQKCYSDLKVCSDRISSAVKFMDFFVHDILDYAVLQKDVKGFIKNSTFFDVREAIQETIEILEDKARAKNIQIQTQFENFVSARGKNNFFVKTDYRRMQQVLLNLLSNAIKFTPKDGVILNRIKQVFDGEHPESDKLLISVSDNGKGIKKKHKKQLFKLYGSIKSETENSKGIGLGLVISKMIVEKFDGVINFVSKFQKGTTFYFTFQVCDYSSEELQEFLHDKVSALQRPFEQQESNRILICDDELFIQQSMNIMLKKANINTEKFVDFCNDG